MKPRRKLRGFLHDMAFRVKMLCLKESPAGQKVHIPRIMMAVMRAMAMKMVITFTWAERLP